ncbi:iron-sulfur cluster repair di-iron protein [Bacillus pseudomycoides]|uniref:Iron-sulfur cluster repair di-iron protein n=1 Tax=Bacillus pseudomycoides TaxID=64104 RepID=A0A2B6RFU6_9BACI|nr:iron-sulfur cluster repair di-iron protein [Bacillus pseudomycoides]PDY45625.1 iron-sulfur cluster repair di-iron protein [Bacillus pseudomycoides]PEA83543.1 iron-sulfur cluster repair di-iron protein [Bacillus pseudomycoides]PED07942.1 iron-sulfur cluster repair di-iron protein [Bacillus pseudomycoides]PED73088.1 iron-sulfur cluster repair di-iron protein [Bacillus pseudomycoides]PEI42296.1 iron-sulfur cluster repair di-iron protein [Bacillus pseudomycoides]
MKHIFTENSVIGDIVTQFPKASDLFKSYRIDFCCGGNRPIIDAINERSLSAEEILTKLNTLYHETKQLNESEFDWKTASYSELIDYIVNKHHRYLNEELPLLSPYVTKVLRVHGAGQPHLAQIHKLFHELKTELEQHLIKEETEDFPLILAFEQNPTDENYMKLRKVVDELENEHNHAGDIIKELRKVTNDFTPPVGACGTYRLVYQRLEALESDLFEHIHLENNVLFPRAIAQV